MQRFVFWWCSLAQMTAWIPCSFRYNSAANNMPRGGAIIYSQNPVHNHAGRADAKDLAGFMLNPEYGDSTMMYVATSNRAHTTPQGRAPHRAGKVLQRPFPVRIPALFQLDGAGGCIPHLLAIATQSDRPA